MPQLDPSSFASQLFWLTVSFVVLYVLLARFLLPRVQSVLGVRSQTLGGDLAAAERMKAEAMSARETYEKALAAARAKSQALLSEAHAAMAAQAAERQHRLAAEMDKRLAASDAAIRAAKKDVMDKLAPASGELVSLIVETLVHQKPSPKEIGAVLSGLAKERSL